MRPNTCSTFKLKGASFEAGTTRVVSSVGSGSGSLGRWRMAG